MYPSSVGYLGDLSCGLPLVGFVLLVVLQGGHGARCVALPIAGARAGHVARVEELLVLGLVAEGRVDGLLVVRQALRLLVDARRVDVRLAGGPLGLADPRSLVPPVSPDPVAGAEGLPVTVSVSPRSGSTAGRGVGCQCAR